MRLSFVLTVTVIVSVAVCNLLATETTSTPASVIDVLEAAGDNRAELEKVISHYESESDSLKLEAAYFLIGNMAGHSFVDYKLLDSSGTEIEFTPIKFEDYKSLTDSFKVLEKHYGTLDFKRNDPILDQTTITADFLIEQIDLAFQAWRKKKWAKDISFEDFIEYILPYRGSNEPLERWRKLFYEKYSDIEQKMTNPSDPIEAANIINDDIKTWFTFDPRYYYHPTDQSMSEMIETGIGRCEDMTNVTIYAMRANGLAVTSDYTPYWANSGNNHAWNAIVRQDGTVTPFMGAESNPGKYRLANKMAKVYRKTYGEQKGNLVFQERKQEKTPRWLNGKNYKDVTANYCEVSDLTISLERDVPDSIDIAYLCVFNSGEWKAIHWGRIDNNKAIFYGMGRGIAYLPALYINEKIVPFGDPFILNDDETMKILAGNKEIKTSVLLSSTTKRKLVESTDGVAKSFLTQGIIYELYYWSNGWKLIEEKNAGEEPLRFDSVPSGSLYWLREKDSDHEERIFTIENGKQVWW